MQHLLWYLGLLMGAGVLVCCLLFLWRFLRHIYKGYGVPFLPSSDIKLQKFLEIIELTPGQTFLDIGCGDGKILEAVQKKYPDNRVVGIENSPVPYKQALGRRQKNSLNYEIMRGDFFRTGWSDYDVIHSYTISYLMPKIWKKIQQECKGGTVLYSSSFPVTGVQGQEVRLQSENYSGKYYIYTLGQE